MFSDVHAGFFVLRNYYNSETTPMRKVQHYEIEIIEKCSGTCFINDVKYMPENANLLFAKPGDIRFTMGKLECSFIKFKSSDKEICDILDSIDSGMIFADCKELAEVISEASKKIKSDKPKDKMELMSLVCKSVALLVSDHSHANTQINTTLDIYTNRIIDVKQYLDKNFGEKITLENMAALTFLSPNFFRVKFLEIMGISPHDYLIEVRISNAKSLLSDTDTPLSQIALMCGFESQAYMNYVFKKETGISPGNYRRKNRE